MTDSRWTFWAFSINPDCRSFRCLRALAVSRLRVSCITFNTDLSQSFYVQSLCPKSRLSELGDLFWKFSFVLRLKCSHSVCLPLSDVVFPLLGSSPGEAFFLFMLFLLFSQLGFFRLFFFVHHPLPSAHPHRTPIPLGIVYRSCCLRRCCYLHHASLRLLKAVSAVSPIDWIFFGFSGPNCF